MFVADAIAASDRAAAAAVKVKESVAGVAGGDVDSDAQNKEQKEFASRVARIQNQYMTEQELLRQHKLLMDDIERGYREGLIATDSEYMTIREQAEKRHQENLKGLREQSQNSQLGAIKMFNSRGYGMVVSALSSISSATETNNKQDFEKQKKRNESLAWLSLPVSVLQSFQNGGGYPWGIAPATAMGVAGMKQINDIKKQSYGGGGGGGVGTVAAPSGGGGSAAGGSASPGPSSVMNVSGLSAGSFLDGETVRMIGEKLLDFQRNGGEVVFTA